MLEATMNGPLGKPVPGVRLIRGLNRTKKEPAEILTNDAQQAATLSIVVRPK